VRTRRFSAPCSSVAMRSEALPTVPGTFSDLLLLNVELSCPALGLTDLHDSLQTK